MANCLKRIINSEDNDIIITWGGRYIEVEQSILGINNTNIYGVSGEPSFYHNAGHSDNPGLYIFGQVLHKLFDLNALEVIKTFSILVYSLGFIFFLIGVFLSVKSNKGRILGILSIVFLTLIVINIPSLWVVPYLATSLLLILVYIIDNLKVFKYKLLIVFIAGLIFGLLDLTRPHASTAVVLFLVLYILFLNKNFIKKLLIIVSLLIGIVFTNIFWNQTINEPRNEFLLKHNPSVVIQNKHPFWHSIYIGLGYISNPSVSEYRDEIGFQKVASIKEGVSIYSIKYENILKKEVILFIFENTRLFMYQLLIKVGVVSILLLVFMTPFVLYSLLHKISFKDSIPFLIAVAFTYLPGILVVPYTYYLVGLVSIGSVMFIFYSDKYLSIVENEDKYKYSSSIYFYGALLYLFFCIFYLQSKVIDSGYIKMLLINLLK
ncbi:hypothetical protein [Aliarcobacter cryaerophilus]|uniref:hypothetical protein n=1 Tax=Aliarcobacter cryaerophilus TaxID=28198 RepID=UPI000830CAB8|nr:hypothetical protein [Aliarcobacter cryaerophilus]